MHDSGGVCCGKRAGNLSGHIQRFFQREWLFIHQRAQRLAINEFGDDELSTVRATNLMNGDDVGMIKR